MADQKALKKRLKALMARPDNQICSDCPEKKPTWASLIVPPPGSPPGTTKIGAFCCLECSGSHRRLGVHISFVRSVNLDSWKEDEVRAMENGGNAVVNSIFEARLAQSGAAKPTNLADGPTRERFIRDKYERRKYFDPAGYSNVGMPMAAAAAGAGAIPPSPTSGPQTFSSPSPSRGTPSDVARQRVANRQARMRTAHSQMDPPTETPPPTRQNVAPAPVSAPVVFDLLDFGEAPTTTTAPAPVHDPFAPTPPTATSSGSGSGIAPSQPDPFAVSQLPSSQPTASHPAASQPTPSAFDFMTPTPSNPPSQPKPSPQASNDSILALFNKPPPQTSFIGVSSPGFAMATNHASVPTTTTANANSNANGNGNAFMINQNMMAMQGTHGMQNFTQQTPNNSMMMQNMNMNMNMNTMMNPQYQSHMMGTPMHPTMMGMHNQQNMMGMNFQQQQLQQQQQQQQFMAGGMMNGSNNNMNFNSMMHGMQQLNVSMGNQHLMGAGTQFGSNGNNNPSMDDGGFGTPMGGNTTTAKTDPFSSLGGVNAFR